MYTFPVFSYEKKGIAGCNNCEATFIQSEMTPEMLEETGVYLRRYNPPWYSFIVGAVIVFLVMLSMLTMFK